MPKNAPPRWASASSTTVSPSSAHGDRTDGPHAELPVTGRVGDERAGDVRAEAGRRRCPSTGGWSQYHDSRSALIVADAPPASSVRATLNSPRTVGRYLVIDPPGSNVTSSPRADQRVERTPAVVGADTGAAATLRPAVAGVRTDQRHRGASSAPAGAGRRRSSAAPSPVPRPRRMTSRVSASSAVTSVACRSIAAPIHSPSASSRATATSSSRSLTSPASTARRRCGPALARAVPASRGRGRRAATRPRCGCRTSR